MTIKIAVELNDDHRAFAEKMVAEGLYPSISSVVQAGIEQMMQNEAAPADALAGMTDEIRRRMELPRDQWIPFDKDTMFDDIRAMIRTKKAERSNDL